MKVKTYVDVLKASQLSGVPIILVAEAFGIKTPLHILLDEATDNQGRWVICRQIDAVCSDLRTKTLSHILKNATTLDELWEVWAWAIPGSKLAADTFRTIRESSQIGGITQKRTHPLPMVCETCFDTKIVQQSVRSIIENIDD